MANRRQCPTFFKILLDASEPHLLLPSDFVKIHMENKMPRYPIIQPATGGQSWSLRIRKIGEFYLFSEGWSNVVRDFQLDSGDFLVFKFMEPSEKQPPLSGKTMRTEVAKRKRGRPRKNSGEVVGPWWCDRVLHNVDYDIGMAVMKVDIARESYCKTTVVLVASGVMWR
ncbi:hypothetical protein E3N88_45186 [Mikania micrantha]|uniref:TF-B3 domain-containing protein n=1 Tax=Mikania micrantha TaxID=192012 RepID=A0A5N6L9W9_9ASTR|nr:hypothetical protein E3N88_45189 [Mikania micrantha]KAC9845609.1 hypothetical protein E3N88_45186 [Mikania micrantha]